MAQAALSGGDGRVRGRQREGSVVSREKLQAETTEMRKREEDKEIQESGSGEKREVQSDNGKRD